MLIDPESVKRLTVYSALSGSACLKAACRTLMQLTPKNADLYLVGDWVKCPWQSKAIGDV